LTQLRPVLPVADCRHRKSPLTRRDRWSYELVNCSMYQRNRSRPSLRMDADEVMHMALTFGTLLSSQGAEAHLHGPFGPIGGNPRNSTRFDRAGQPRSLTWPCD
jgi:hypothetical protein